MKRLLILFAFLLAAPFAQAQGVPNFWTDEGPIMGATTQGWNATLLYRTTGCKVDASPCFALWWSNSCAGICYAESPTAMPGTWSLYTVNDANGTVISGQDFAKIYQNGSTFYGYTSSAGCLGTSCTVNVYTSSDGVTWTLALANALSYSQASWEDATGYSCIELRVLTVDSTGKWWGYYSSYDSTYGSFPGGLVTSTDGINWTKSALNPVIPQGTGGFAFLTVNDVYYGWSQIGTAFPGLQGDGFVPTDISRFSAANPGGPWTFLNSLTIPRWEASESPGIVDAQIADPTILSANGNMYMIFEGGPSGNYQLHLAYAANATPQQLVSSYEGINGVPTPGTYTSGRTGQPYGAGLPGIGSTLNLNQVATDNFTRADGGLGTNWTTLTGAGAPAIVSDQVGGAAAGAYSIAYYSNASFPNDQYAYAPITTMAALSTECVATRANGSSAYLYCINGTIGSGDPTWNIYLDNAGSITSLANGTIASTQYIVGTGSGSYIEGAVVGSNLYLYTSGSAAGFGGSSGTVLIGIATDSTLASGSPGIAINATTATTNAYMGTWSGGGFKAAPTITLPKFAGGVTHTPVQWNLNNLSNGSGVGTASAAYIQNVQAGNMLFVVVSWQNGGTITSVTDSLLQTYTCQTAITSNHYSTQACYMLNSLAGADTVTVNFSSAIAEDVSVHIYEWAGVTAVGPSTQGVNNGGAASQPAASVTTTAPSSLVVAYGLFYNAGVIPPSGTWFSLIPYALNGCTGACTNEEYLPSQSPGTYTSGWGTTNIQYWNVGLSTFYLSIGGTQESGKVKVSGPVAVN